MFLVTFDIGENPAEGLMPPSILTEAAIEADSQRWERVGRFVQTYRESARYDPSEAGIAHHLECKG